MKKIIITLLIASPLLAMQKQNQILNLIAFNKACVKSRGALGDLQLLKHKDNFYVAKNGIAHLVKKYDIDRLLKSANEEQLLKYFQNDGYIQIEQLSNQDYILKVKGKILGGGAGGAAAGILAGKFLVHFTAQVGIGLASVGVTLVAGPVVGYATFQALEVTLAPAIETASIYGAFAGGMMGGVATGPV